MDKFQVSCPHCNDTFEVIDEYRGEQVNCPDCEGLFMIPLEGSKGVPLDGSNVFDVSCPKCSASFEVPDDYRGEIADCPECGITFEIPPEGTVGIIVPAETEEPEEEKVDETVIKEMPSPEELAKPSTLPSGIQPMDNMMGGGAKKSATVKLSRSAIMNNTMMPAMDEKKAKNSRNNYGPTPDLSAQMTIKKPRPEIATPKPMAQEPAKESHEIKDPQQNPARASQKVKKPKPSKHRAATLPGWAPSLHLHKNERILECIQPAPSGFMPVVAMTCVSALLVPVAAIISHSLDKVMTAIIFGIMALILWGAAMMILKPIMSKKALVLTNERAFLIQRSKVVEVILD